MVDEKKSIIKDLKIENDDYTIKNSANADCIMDLAKVNIFVGANNTGKSRFMRSLFYVDENHPLKFKPNDPQLDTFKKQVEEFRKSNKKKRPDWKMRERYKIVDMLYDIEYVEESNAPFQEFIQDYIAITNPKNHFIRKRDKYLHGILKKYFNEIDINNNSFKYNFYSIYIPSLRGLKPLISSEFKSNDQSNDVYAERIKKDYFPNAQNINNFNDFLEGKSQYPKHSIITGLQFYEYVTNYLLGDLNQRNIIKDYEEYLYETFFNEEVTLIPKVKDDVLTIKIGDEERPIYDLGEGIQSIILITLPLFLYLDLSKENNTNVLVFIEEPEVGLHPKLQRILLKTLLDKRFENFQFFFTTHSNHFIDRQFEDKDISIYLFDKKNTESNKLRFNIEKVPFNHLPTLKELGALPSAVLMSNCVILVEGTNDSYYYPYYLDLYQAHLNKPNQNEAKFKDKVNYSFLIGGGSELEKTVKDWGIKDRLFCIVDSDNEPEEKEKIFEKMNVKNYYILKVPTAENLIPKKVLIKILKEMGKEKGWKVNEDFDAEEYKGSNFYTFIKEDILIWGHKKTDINDKKWEPKLKRKLAKKQKEYIKNYDDLIEEARDVVEKMYEFIESSN